MAKTLIPNDFRDFLSLISLVGFIAIFFKFALQSPFLSARMDSIFLVFAGIGLMVIGKVFSIVKWTRDGIQRNEFLQLFSITFGLSSVIVGFLLLFDFTLSLAIQGFIGFLALAPAVFIFFDYLSKNK